MSGIIGLLLAAGGTDIPYVGASAVASTSTTTLTINKPSGVVAGDLMIAVMASEKEPTWAGDTGWTEIADLGGLPGLRVARKLAGGSEGVSYNFTASTGGSDKRHSGIILAYRDAAFDAAGSFDTSSSGNAIDAPSVNLSAAGLLLAVYAVNQASRTFTTPSGMAALLSDSDATPPSFAVFSQQLGAGATGIKSSTPDGGGSSAGILIGLRSA